MSAVLGIVGGAALIAAFIALRTADRRPHACEGCTCSGGTCVRAGYDAELEGHHDQS